MPVPDSDAVDYAIEEVAAGQVERTVLLPVTPGYPFIYFHHPENWEIGDIGDNETAWLPELQEVAIMPGVLCCRTLREGENPEEAYIGMIDMFRKRGLTHIPPTVDVNGAGGLYAKRIACQDPRNKRKGHLYFDRWSVPKKPRSGKKTKFKRDQVAFNKWRLSLVTEGWTTLEGDKGRIRPPAEDIILDKVSNADDHLARHIAETGTLPEDARGKIIGQAQARLERAEGAIVPRYQPTPQEVGPDATVVRMLVAQANRGEALTDIYAMHGIDPDSATAKAVEAQATPKQVRKAPAKVKGVK